MGWAEAELSLTLISDRAMARLNRETFGRPGPTNVIAFPVDGADERGGGEFKGREGELGSLSPPRQDTPSGPPLLLGEVVISLETTRRQAAENGWPWEELFDFYLIHGILHLIGWDHDTPEAEAAMEARTWELLEIVRRGGG